MEDDDRRRYLRSDPVYVGCRRDAGRRRARPKSKVGGNSEEAPLPLSPV